MLDTMEAKDFAPLPNFVDLLLDAICIVDADGRFVFVSAACERIFGYTQSEMIGMTMIEMVAPEDRSRTLQAANKIMSGHPQLHFENRYIRKDGRVADIMWSARWSETDRLRIAVARDITELKRAESMQAALYSISEAAHAAENLLALYQRIHQIIGELLPALNFSVALYDEKDKQLSFPYHVDEYKPAPRDSAAVALCAEVIRTGQPLLLTDEMLTVLPEHLRTVVDTNSLCWLVVPLNSHNGVIGALVLKSYSKGIRYTEKDKELLQFVSTQIATAIERKRLYTRLQYTSQYDELTDLPNRRLLYDRLKTALARTQRKQGRMSLVYLDLDNFKQVNDAFGHTVGDQLLQEVAKRLKQCVREADTVARIGGDEFVVLLEDIQLPEHASVVAEKIRTDLSYPISIDGCNLHIQPSIGIALCPDHGDSAQQLLKHADEAMYFAKKHSDNRIQTNGGSSRSVDGANTESSLS
ncbi:MAG TPA: diguanylate cyclase [Burkholderiales bacterium]|nr:diguanylate cyclase [Burkholderiales bacterium]